jgi:hypothetical protein
MRLGNGLHGLLFLLLHLGNPVLRTKRIKIQTNPESTTIKNNICCCLLSQMTNLLDITSDL